MNWKEYKKMKALEQASGDTTNDRPTTPLAGQNKGIKHPATKHEDEPPHKKATTSLPRLPLNPGDPPQQKVAMCTGSSSERRDASHSGLPFSEYEVILNNRTWCVPTTGRFRPVPLPIRYAGRVKARVDLKRRELYLDGICFYRLGQPKRVINLHGMQLEVGVQGPIHCLWIDGHQFAVRQDAPPEPVLIAGRQHEIAINGLTKRLIIDGHDICPCNTSEPQHAWIAFEEHEFMFSPPPRQISSPCQKYFEEGSPAAPFPSQSPAPPAPPLDIDSMLSKLVTSGVIKNPTPDLTHFEREKLQGNYKDVVDSLHTGTQCASCARRFQSDQKDSYEKHLDWHFQQNTRHSRNRHDNCRGWFIGRQDWVQLNKTSDLEPKAEAQSNFFELEQKQRSAARSELIITCPADEGVDDKCPMCHEPFDELWNGEDETWLCQNAMRVGNQIYHPGCYEDYQKQFSGDFDSTDATEDGVNSVNTTAAPGTNKTSRNSAWAHFRKHHQTQRKI